MSYKTLFKVNSFKYLNLSDIDKIESFGDEEISSEENLFGTKIKEENITDKLNYESNLNPFGEKIERITTNNTYNNQNIIYNFNFCLKNKEDNKDSINLNSNILIKDSDKLNIKKESKKRGRKTKPNTSSKNENNGNIKTTDIHDRYSDDNIRKKCKNMILKYALEFLNKKIKEIYNGNIGKGKFKKKLKILNQDKKVNLSLNEEKLFLEKTLGEIFSENISARLSNYPLNYNKVLIESLITEKDDEKKKCFINLFNITFFDCLRYFRGDEIYKEELNGFKKFSSIKETLIEKDGKEYVDLFIYYLQNFKQILENKKPRNTKSIKMNVLNK